MRTLLLTITVLSVLWLSNPPVHGGLASVSYCGVTDDGIASSHPGILPPPTASLGTKRLVFFRARFPDDERDPISAEEVEQMLDEVNRVFLRISYGKFGLEWTIPPVLHLAKQRDEFAGPGGFDKFLADVRAAGMAAGIDYQDYDLDVVRHSGVPGFSAGNANLGFRGAQVQADGAIIIVHELGHNLGLSHANAWVTGSPGLSVGSPPLPSNYDRGTDPRTISVYPDSALGHESIVGPGYSAEYGDASDIMGSGMIEFSAIYRHQLGWLSAAEIVQPTAGLSTNRIQGTDGTLSSPPLPRAIRLGGTVSSPIGPRGFWVQIPPIDTNSVEFPGVQIRWADVSSSALGSVLLAPLAGTRSVNGGVSLPPGQTFSDLQSGVFITVVDMGGEGGSRWVDVVVHSGGSLSNQAPMVKLEATPATAAVNEPVVLSASASDPDTDPLAWRWDFGDGTASTSPGSISKVWRREGDFVVTLEVSDFKGGIARGHFAVRVGDPQTRRITGRVLDSAGQPMIRVRVHNGILKLPDENRPSTSTFTDSMGEYILAGLIPGTYTNGAFQFGLSIARRQPVTVTDKDVTQVDFVAAVLPRVSVIAPRRVAESVGITNLFVFTRTGPTNEPLTVFYELNGTAASGRDYARPLRDRVVIPAGARSFEMLLDVFNDSEDEPDETIRLSVLYPSTAQQRDNQGAIFDVYYPGWELTEIDGSPNWILSEPAYLPGPISSSTVVLEDDDTGPGVPLTLMVNGVKDGLLQLTLTGQPGTRLALETLVGSGGWVQLRADLLLIANSLALTLPVQDHSHAFFRTVQQAGN